MLELIKAGNWVTVRRELQGPETGGTILIEDDVLHVPDNDNEITEISRSQILLLCILPYLMYASL